MSMHFCGYYFVNSRTTNIQFCWLKLVPNDFSLVVTKTIIMVMTSQPKRKFAWITRKGNQQP